MSKSHPPKSEAARLKSPDEPDVSAAVTPEAGFSSKLSAPRERFLAAVVEHALLVGRRTGKDFLRRFPPHEIMGALADQPRLRAKLLVMTTGVNEKIALKKTASSAAEDLALALAENVTEEDDVVALFDPDDRVRYLDHGKLWSFLIEGEFWRISAEGIDAAVAAEHVAFILSQARVEKLLTDREIIDGIGLDVLVESLPKEDLGRVLEKALVEGRAGRVFKDERVVEVLPPRLLVEHVSLAHLWERLVATRLAFATTAGAPVAATPTVSAPAPAAPPPASVLPPVSAPPMPSASAAPEADASAPALELSIDEGEGFTIEEEPDDVTRNLNVEAMLANVLASDGITSTEDRITLEAEPKPKADKEKNGSRRTSRPPPA